MFDLTKTPVRHTLRAAAAAVAVAAVLVPAPARAERIVTLRGGGWGHGIGMSQYGAYGRALNGARAGAIVRHYYRGTNVGTKSDIPANVRVGLLQYQSEVAAKSSSLSSGGTIAFKVAGSSEIIAKSGTRPTWTVKPSSTGGMQLYKNGVRYSHDGRRVFGSPSRPLVMHYQPYNSIAAVLDTGRRYKFGVLQFGTHRTSSCAAGYCVRLVLSIPMEPYIYGLGEMPSSWHREALKVQALAGRTYVYRKIKSSGQHRVGCDCAVYDSPVDQAYIGDAKRDSYPLDGKDDQWWSNWKAAVDATAGKLILYDGRPIEALYSSSSGGRTENNENVWGGTALPYLRGVKDAADDVVVNGVHINPNHRWTVQMKWSTLSSKLNAYYGTGTLKTFKIVPPVGVSGRVTVVRSDGTGGMKIVGSNRTVRVSGWSVRSALGLRDTKFNVDISYTVGANFQDKYNRLNGAPGDATGPVYGVPKGSSNPLGQAQNFEIGRMTWRRATDKTVWQRGPILTRYNKMGREKSVLGMPTSDLWGPGEYRGASYVNGRILYSKATGARAVWTAFDDAFKRGGGATGKLKLPLTHRQKSSTTLPGGGVRQRFQNGTIYRNPSPSPTGVYFLWGAIDDKYRSIGQGSSDCGYPIADQVTTPTGTEATFENGTITANAAGVTITCP